MSSAATIPRYTPDDLLRMEGGERFDLVDGQLVERPMGYRSGRVGGKLFSLLESYCSSKKLGWVLPSEVGYECFGNKHDKVRHPDVSFISAARMSPEEEPRGFCLIPPDLAAEVTSPNDVFEEVLAKVTEYQSAGVRLIWVIDSESGRTLIFRPTGPGTILSMNDELDGEDVLPGFRCKIADLFKLPIEV
jgi:Uma2 family endonuclease